MFLCIFKYYAFPFYLNKTNLTVIYNLKYDLKKFIILKINYLYKKAFRII